MRIPVVSIKNFMRLFVVLCPLVFSVAYGVNEAKPASLQSIYFLLLGDEKAASFAATAGIRTIVIASLSNGQFTLNNPWTQSELDYENIGASIQYESLPGFNQWMRPYTSLMVEYSAKFRQCEEDYNSFRSPGAYTSDVRTYTFTDRECYPRLEWVHGLNEPIILDPLASQVLYRYGYYCGGGYPGGTAEIFDAVNPEPLDGVDYCCRLHDQGVWLDRGQFSNECGMLMCLQKASVKGLAALPSAVEEARQYWYGDGWVGGAATVCPLNQSDDAPPPVVN